MTNFEFVYSNNLGFPHSMSVKFGLWTFHELSKWQKILTLLTFGCLSYNNKNFVHACPFSILNIEVNGPLRRLWAPERGIGCTPSRGTWAGMQL